MFEFLTQNDEDAIAIIKKDHDKVKDLFDKFEKAETLREKRKIVADTIMELKIHAAIEEEIFYAVVRKQIDKKIMNEADEEHHVVKVLISELEEMNGREDHYDAKYKVLSENVRHHIKEEESEMLPRARALGIDFEALGRQLLARKQQLRKNGVATFAEEKMVAASKGRGDSPAKNAQRANPVRLKAAGKSSAKTTNTLGKSSKVARLSKTVKSLAKKAVKKPVRLIKSSAKTTSAAAGKARASHARHVR